MRKPRPIWPASAAQAADWPRLAEAQGSLRHGLSLKGASGEPAGRAWDGTHLAPRSGCRRGWRCPQKARGAILRARVCPGPADGPGRLSKHETADPKVATALPQPTEAGGVSADTGMPSGGCRLLARPAGLAIVELS
eukprot:scaffold37565_cov74-Phaeocystis_antarctica.AAC.2